MKTYVITLSKWFPARHNRAGDSTFFHEALFNALHNTESTLTIDDADDTSIQIYKRKIHTIRANYPLWAKRIAEVERGEACVSIRQWTGKPYRSKQVEIAKLTKADGIGVQRLDLSAAPYAVRIDDPIHTEPSVLQDLSANDGLSLADWQDWFKDYDKSKPLAIIHFTKFRY